MREGLRAFFRGLRFGSICWILWGTPGVWIPKSFFYSNGIFYISYVTKQKDMSVERQKAAAEIKSMADANGGKIFMGMVHHMYGPLRGLNFILDNPDIEEVMTAMDSQEASMEISDQMKLVEEVKKRAPKNVVELCFKIWAETALSPRLMILPFDMTDQAENYPNTVISITKGVDEVANILKMTSSLQGKDAFFYRVGII